MLLWQLPQEDPATAQEEELLERSEISHPVCVCACKSVLQVGFLSPPGLTPGEDAAYTGSGSVLGWWVPTD